MDRVGDFWRYFSREEADAFWAFCLRMHAQLPQAMAADEAQARQVASVFEELLAEGYPSSDDRLTWERLRHVTRHRTKLNADLRLSSVNRHTGDVCLEMRLTGLTYLGWHRFGMKAGKVRPLKPQHIAVTYVD